MDKLKKWAIPLALAALPVVALAQLPPATPPGTALTLDKLEDIINTVANWLIVVGVVIAVIYIVWGGVQWMAARGDSGKVTKAKDAMKAGLIGAIIVLGVGVIIRTLSAVVVRTFFGAGQ
jgi:TRAP-type C4-dicarboxylate transport system permease small subunit